MYTRITEHIEIDRKQRSVRRDGVEVHLTGLEYGLFDYLCARANKVCTRVEILDHVWGERFRYDTGTIDVHLNALRRKLGFGNSYPIRTVRGVGLVFRVERAASRYTIDLQAFLSDWLHNHAAVTGSAGMSARLQLTPFVNELTIAPESLRRWLDASLDALMPSGDGGTLTLRSKLTVHSFILSMDVSGSLAELRIPIYRDN